MKLATIKDFNSPENIRGEEIKVCPLAFWSRLIHFKISLLNTFPSCFCFVRQNRRTWAALVGSRTVSYVAALATINALFVRVSRSRARWRFRDD